MLLYVIINSGIRRHHIAKISCILEKTVVCRRNILRFFLCFLLALNVFSSFSKSISLLFIYSFFWLLSILLIIIFRKRIFTGSIIWRILLTVSIALTIRLIAVYFLGLTMQGDYAIYLSVARSIKNGDLKKQFYFGIFPHALNYPIFISLFYRVLGEMTWLPRMINIIRVITKWQTQYTRFRSDDLEQTYSLIVYAYNTIVILGAIIALIFLSLDKKAPLLMKTISFYMIGSIMLFMVMETATRYKGAYYSVLTLLAAYGYWRVYCQIKSRFLKSWEISALRE